MDGRLPSGSKFFRRVLIHSMIFLMLGVRTASACLAQGPQQQSRAASADKRQSAAADFSHPEDLSAFIEPFFEENMKKHGIPGAVFVAVKDGKVILEKGFGYADIEKNAAADPSGSLFRIASVSKIFASVAVLQLEEKGLIRLDDDVNKYLDKFQVSDPFPKPLTIGDLLTHTDGFEERNTRIFALESGDLPPLEELLSKELKPLTNPPGEMITYGSFSSALASCIVEIVTGMPFAEYVQKNIFLPLHMTGSTLEQALPAEALEKVATTYITDDGGFEPTPYLLMTTPATGGASVTGTDMGRFLMALLQNGRLNGAAILEEASVQKLLDRQFGVHPDVPGITYGFFEHFENGRRCLLREGSGLGVNSRIFMLPEENMAFFTAYNTRGSEMNIELTSALLDRYYPSEELLPEVSNDLTGNASECAGMYGYVQASKYTLTKISRLFAGLLHAAPNADGSLTITPVGMGDPYGGFEDSSRWIETKPLLFEREDGKGTICFAQSEDGSEYRLFSGQGYHGSYQRMRWHETPYFHITVISLFVLAYILSVFLNLKRRGRIGRALPDSKTERALGIAVSTLNAVFIAASMPVMFLAGATAGFPSVAFVGGLHPLVLGVLTLPVLSIALTGIMIFVIIRGMARRRYDRTQRTLLTGYILCCLLFYMYLWYWNLIGIRL